MPDLRDGGERRVEGRKGIGRNTGEKVGQSNLAVLAGLGVLGNPGTLGRPGSRMGS